jgi:phenylacetate-CoA ligase
MGVSNECAEHRGLHISTEHCIVEVVDDAGKPAAPYQAGNLAITDLDNYTMPFIRYVNGDIAHLKTEICPCKRTLPLMSYVEGRACDMITGTNGFTAHALFFVTLLQRQAWYERYAITKFEIVQKTKTMVECRFVANHKPETGAQQEFIEVCRQFFGKDMDILVYFVDEILPGKSGKHRYVRAELSN